MDSPPRYSSENAYSNCFFEFENEHLFEKYITHGFILERPKKLDSFRVVGVQKIVEDRGWVSTISNIPRFITKDVHEFYANLSDNIVVQGETQFERVFVKGHIYEFSPRLIYEYLNIPILENFEFEKDYVLDDVATELLNYKCVWPTTNVLRVVTLPLSIMAFTKFPLTIGCPSSM